MNVIIVATNGSRTDDKALDRGRWCPRPFLVGVVLWSLVGVVSWRLLNIKAKVAFYCCLYFLWLNANIPLCDGGAAVL